MFFFCLSLHLCDKKVKNQRKKGKREETTLLMNISYHKYI